MAADKISINVFGPNKTVVARECLMSFGLLNVLVRLIGDVNRVGVLDIDPDLADEVITEVLMPRLASGKRQPPDGYETPDLTSGDAEKVFDFVKEHLMSFFLRRLRATADLMDARKEDLERIASFLGGSLGSASNVLSSGPSNANPAT